jgi:hypothetical protein
VRKESCLQLEFVADEQSLNSQFSIDIIKSGAGKTDKSSGKGVFG